MQSPRSIEACLDDYFLSIIKEKAESLEFIINDIPNEASVQASWMHVEAIDVFEHHLQNALGFIISLEELLPLVVDIVLEERGLKAQHFWDSILEIQVLCVDNLNGDSLVIPVHPPLFLVMDVLESYFLHLVVSKDPELQFMPVISQGNP